MNVLELEPKNYQKLTLGLYLLYGKNPPKTLITTPTFFICKVPSLRGTRTAVTGFYVCMMNYGVIIIKPNLTLNTT